MKVKGKGMDDIIWWFWALKREVNFERDFVVHLIGGAR